MAHPCIYTPNCTLSFGAPREALNHALAEHVRYKADPGYDFTCRIVNCACGGATFEKRDGIVTHLTLKANIYDVACERGCGRMFKRTSEMRTHLKKCQGIAGVGRSRAPSGAHERKSLGANGGPKQPQQQQQQQQQQQPQPQQPQQPQQQEPTRSASPTKLPPLQRSPPQPSPPRQMLPLPSPPPLPPPYMSPQRNGVATSPPLSSQRTTLVVNGTISTSASPSQSPATPASVPVSSLINGPIPSSNPNSPKRTLASPMQQQPPAKKVRAWIGKMGKWVDMEVTEPS